MFKNALSGIDDVAIYPIISLSVFVVFFVLLGYLVIRADKKYIKHMEEMPLDKDWLLVLTLPKTLPKIYSHGFYYKKRPGFADNVSANCFFRNGSCVDRRCG